MYRLKASRTALIALAQLLLCKGWQFYNPNIDLYEMTTKMKTAVKTLIFVSTLSAVAMSASATTISFDSLEQVGGGFQSLTSYNENGFNLSAGQFASAQQGNTAWYFGSASLFNNYSGGITTLTKIGGGTFDFSAIDLAPVSTMYSPGATVSFVGNVHGGGSVNTSFTLNNTYAFQTFLLSGFNNLDSVTWRQDSPYSQFDNVVLDRSVPEPASLALFGIGLVGLNAFRRKKANAA
ncbi:MAG: PEP-CTERM sorting domain-containing protein [Sulfuriferula sp.]